MCEREVARSFGASGEAEVGGGKYQIAAQRAKFAEVLSRIERAVVVGLLSGIEGKIVLVDWTWISRVGGILIDAIKVYLVRYSALFI